MRRGRNLLLAFGAMLALTGAAVAEPQYTLTIESEPYAPLTDATVLEMPWGPEAESPYGYIYPGTATFRLMNIDYKMTSQRGIGVSKWGNLQIDGSASSIIIDPFFTILDSTSEAAEVRYKIEGEPGDIVVKIEWSNVGFPNCPPDIGTSFQIWLYERSGEFELRYGETRDACDSAYNGGMDKGPYVGIFRGTPNFSAIFEIFWLQGDPANPEIVDNGFPYLTGAPAAGTVYRFAPTSTSSVDEGAEGTSVARVVPNPASDRAMLEFTTESSANVHIDLYDGIGRFVRTVNEGRREAGDHAVEIDLSGLASGTYVVKGEIGERSIAVPIVVP